MKYNLQDKVVIVTGAGSGIGLATVKAFIAEGAKVVGADIDTTALEELKNPEQIFAVKTDFFSTEDVENLVAKTIEKYNRIDVLFNNVGIANSHDGFLEVTDEQWQKTFDLNLFGYVRATRAVLPHMVKQGKGVILHTASEAAKMPNALLPEYSVSKAAVAMFAKVIAAEFTRQGVRSNAISPACIRTGIFDKPGGLADTLAEKFSVDREEALKRFVEMMGIPVGRLGKPEEIAALAVYLASDQAEYITGANFMIDGGVTPVL